MKNNDLENKLIIHGDEPYIKKEAFAFFNKPEVKLLDGIKIIEDSAFYYSGIKKIVFPNTLKRIETKAFYNNKLITLVIPDNVEYIGESCFFQNSITNIKLSENLKIITDMSFENNNLKILELPDSITKVGKKAFLNNDIENLKLSSNLIEIDELAFAKNEINNLKLFNSIEKIGKGAFLNNKIVHLQLPNKLKIINECAFKNNKIETIKFNQELTEIGEEAFYNNKIKELNLPPNILKIKNYTFSFNLLEKIKFNNNLQYIGSKAFYNNKIKELCLPPSIIDIAESSFTLNEIKNLVLPNNLKEIKYNTFSHNKIENLILPSNIEKIERKAFDDNNISYILLNSNLKYIGENAFTNNNLKNITIPSNIEKIEKCAFDENVIIKINNKLLPDNFIKKFGTENIVKASKILEIWPSFKFEYINKKMMNDMMLTEDTIKGFANNIKIFNKLIEESNIVELGNKDMDEYTNFYKMCYIFGLFNTGGIKQQEIINRIKEFLKIYNINQIHQLFNDIKINDYNEKLSNIILNEYNHPKLKEIFAKFYNNHSVICKSILENRKEIIGILNSLYNKEKNNFKKQELEIQLKQLKQLKKIITIDDIIKYISEHTFIIRESNEKLNNIINILNSYINQEEFDEIQKIYEKGKLVDDKYFLNIVDRKQDGIHYYWPSKDNPINIILGYLCDCCAKYGGSGQDIMIQSIINPNIKNLVIYDSMRNVLAKSTAFYNEEKRYLLLNNVEICHRFINNKNTKTKDFEELYDALIRGIEDQVSCMHKKGYLVDEVRIGMARNDLSNTIIRRKNEIKHSDFLLNYNYNNCDGDANIQEYGQAILKIKKK